jgi:site-specific recombinase XerD
MTELPVRVADQYRAAAFSPHTVRAYRADLTDFARWLRERGVEKPSAADVADYLASLPRQGLKVSTVRRRAATLGKVFGFSIRRDPLIGPVLAGIERTHGVRQQGRDALLLEDLLAVLPAGDDLLAVRDRALLLLGFAGGFRRGELAALQVEDLQFREEGLAVLVRRGKTDPEGAGRKVGIPFGEHEATCPVRALRSWLEAGVIRNGPVFRRVYGRHVGQELEPQAVWCIVRRLCAKAGLDARRFGAHSLRAGMVTQAIRGGASDHAIMAQTGHRSSDMVRRYRRETDLFQDNAADRLGL